MSRYDEISKDGLEDMLDDKDAEIERLTNALRRIADASVYGGQGHKVMKFAQEALDKAPVSEGHDHE